MLTRWDVRRYTREAYNLGVRYFGGCCGFEPHHIREIAEEVGFVLYLISLCEPCINSPLIRMHTYNGSKMVMNYNEAGFIFQCEHGEPWTLQGSQ